MAMICLSEAVMVCADGMYPIFYSSIKTGAYYVRCCESGVYGGVCDPSTFSLDFSVRCRDMGFPSVCDCGQSCIGTVHKNKSCTGECTCNCNTTAPPHTIIIGNDSPTGTGSKKSNYYIIGIFIGAAMCCSFMLAVLVYTKSVTLLTKSDIEEGGIKMT